MMMDALWQSKGKAETLPGSGADAIWGDSMDGANFKGVVWYDWKDFFGGLCEKIYAIGQRADRDKVIMEKALECFGADSPIYKLKCSDPFSFIYFLAQKNTANQRTPVYTKVKSALGLGADIPSDWVFPTPYRNVLYQGKKHDTDLLWTVFNKIFSDGDDEISGDEFARILDIKGVACAKLSQTLFLMDPKRFFPLDERAFRLPVFNGEKYADRTALIKDEGLSAYQSVLTQIKGSFPSCEFYEINLLAYLIGSDLLTVRDNYFLIGSNIWGGDDNYIEDFFNRSAVRVGGPTSGGKGMKEYPITDPQRGDIILSRYHSTGNGIGIVLENEYHEHGKFGEKYAIKVIWINKTEKINALNVALMPGFSRAKSARNSFKEKYPNTFKIIDKLIEGSKKMQQAANDTVKNLILQGPPGTGKTRLAKQIALYLQEDGAALDSILNDPNILKNRAIFKTDPDIESMETIKIVQFHPGYTYEDFVRGIITETAEDGKIRYAVRDRVFTEMAKAAAENPGQNYVLIIDEMNRASLPSVLGELIYALEYRGDRVNIIYKTEEDGGELMVPNNLYIIGTMNTADRSIGHIDYAIRRRFVFMDVKSDREVITDKAALALYNHIAELFYPESDRGNSAVSPEFKADDVMIGHSYFLVDKMPLSFRLIYQIKPLLREYAKDGILIGDDIYNRIDAFKA
jgi:hypothetical protein